MSHLNQSMSSIKHEALRRYFIEVIRDLVTRGVISRAAGEPINQILIRESATIMVEIQADFAAVGVEVAVGLGRGLELMVQKKVAEWVSVGQQMMSSFFKPGDR
jgi:hypothetical protein